ncbi:MAG: phosphoribosyltransferase [Rhodoplanes sp.]|uniref:phosphoribosyltransferase n=1 Tax=Rhodoplanes sp. TaxID=1968906 RepID=UPI001810C1CA|nr:phosphoribosyltransferase family protein [Rhodoplanes sp.]NVO14920.1 phosphoribosyltransferase [Rhodoplanes sp.]
MFTDRSDAGRRLAVALRGCTAARPVVLALPRGGVPVAAEIAAALDAPLDLVIARKIGLPQQPELAMGAVVDGDSPIVLRNEDVIAECGIDDATFATACAAELIEIERRRSRYLRDRPRIDVRGRATIVVDDGLATGATARAALRAVRRRHPARLVLAVPVGARGTLREMRDEVDAIVCLERPAVFSAIGAFYDDFRQVDDAEVIAILDRFPAV